MTAINDRNPEMRSFFVLWTGQALSLLGSHGVQFALIWWLTQETGSAAVLAMAALLGLLPTVVLGPVIGALVDRWDRKRIMLAADGLVALASLVLAYLYSVGAESTRSVFVLLFLRGVGGAFHAPAMLASTSLMVPEQHLTRIQGLNQLLQGGINIVAAPLGALLLALFPMGGVMLVDVGTALLAIVPLLFIRVPQPAVATGDANGAEVSLWGEMLAGFRYLAERRGHLILIFMAALINMCLVPAFSLLPLLVSAQFDGNALQLGWMSTGFGIGTIVGGILLGVWGGFKRRVLTSLLALIGLGLSVVALGLAPGYALALTAMILVGFTAPFANGPISAILQATIAAEYQGRVFTLVGSLAAATAPLGLLLAAPVAELVGVRAWYVTGGLVCLAMGAVGFLLPPLLTIEGTRTEAQESDQAALPV
ncbi:MAG: MFS transporter [Candidatus Eisenbacteria bacterium]|nr:MFS transporter [Candidatus Eisenbacteria bacterium]